MITPEEIRKSLEGAPEKALEVFKAIVAICEDEEAFVCFSNDFGGNALTVEISGKGHSHAGTSCEGVEVLIRDLHNMFVDSRGLSFVPPNKRLRSTALRKK